MGRTKYRRVSDPVECTSDQATLKTSRSSGGNRLCSQKLFWILFTLFIAFGAMAFFVFTLAFRSSDNEMELYRRALNYITGERFVRSESSEETDFPHHDILLPRDVLPTRYQVYLHPNLTTFTFEGGVKIEITCKKATKYIILHIKDLEISEHKLSQGHEQDDLAIRRTAQNKKHDQLLVEAEEDLDPGETYTLHLSFSGTLNNKMVGFYRSSYKTKKGDTRYLATTQFESTDARRAFPCFDEPEFKASFLITMVHPRDYTAISNMPLELRKYRDDGLVQSHFQPTVKMSTYLVGFIVSDFGYKQATLPNGVKIRVWARKEALHTTSLALKVTKKVLRYYEKFFTIKYPLPKVDLVAVPDFSAGAMENWGLLTFRETYLLNDPDTSSASDKQSVAIVVAHELAHQWFGNLVTMKWWNDLWLNEGFANYVEYIGTDQYAKQWKVLDQFVAHTLQSALALDSMTNTHPIRVPVHNPSQITEIFDGISYEKGSSVIRMLRSFLGDRAFQEGLELYLREHEYKNAEADDLWSALSKVSGIDVKAVMDTWVTQEGYPVVTIRTSRTSKRNTGGDSLVAHQTRFLRDIGPDSDKYDDATKGYSWYVPLTYITSDSPKKSAMVWMNKTFAHMTNTAGSKWIKANVGQTGFYRVNYEEDNWLQLINQLDTNHKVFSPVDRSGLINDAFSLTRAGLLPLTTALGLTSYLDKERDYVPWSSAFSALGFIGGQLSMKSSYGLYSEYILHKVKPLEKYVGWRNEGSILKKYLRNQVLSSLASHGDYEAVRFCLEGFRSWMSNDSLEISPHLRTTVYHTAVKFGSVHEWEFLMDKYQSSIDPTEKSKLLSGMSGSRDPWLLGRILDYSLDSSKIRTQDMTSAITKVSSNVAGRLLAWDFIRENFNKIIKKLGKDAIEIGYLIIGTTNGFNTEFHLKQVKEFVHEHKDVLGDLRSTKKALEIIQGNIQWMKKHEDEVETWLKKQVEHLRE